ncbi:hypothetical protein [Rugamonas aquatica]|uniref:Thioesterase domain-containing protein n=1 Tax=Rugamonas aquatica TaxID=2743357 RepID=A0A6A7NAV5_9BURK|nr:hypothetical protein [Rugamonas aquatica]MQA42279.1 hypothetical protein [Rugamonas aquatica]
MGINKKLKHAAAGLAGSFVGRNNDVGGYWAPGLLYRDAAADLTVQLRLEDCTATPSTPATMLVARTYADFLRRALRRLGVGWEELALATVDLRFNAPHTGPRLACGEPFTCTVSLASKTDSVVTATAASYCQRYEAGRFTARGGSDASVIASLV